jgi:GTPase SAR1 family protein
MADNKEHINTNTNENYISNKLVILGDVAVGKSSIAQR